MTPEEIFAQFFGGGFPARGGFYTNFGGACDGWVSVCVTAGCLCSCDGWVSVCVRRLVLFLVLYQTITRAETSCSMV
jgi:hypothetical protein